MIGSLGGFSVRSQKALGLLLARAPTVRGPPPRNEYRSGRIEQTCSRLHIAVKQGICQLRCSCVGGGETTRWQTEEPW